MQDHVDCAKVFWYAMKPTNAHAICIFPAAPSAKPQCGGGATKSHCHRSPCGATCAVGEILGMAVPPNQQGQAWCQWGGQVRGWSAWWRRSTFSSRSSLADRCDTGALHCSMTQRGLAGPGSPLSCSALLRFSTPLAITPTSL